MYFLSLGWHVNEAKQEAHILLSKESVAPKVFSSLFLHELRILGICRNGILAVSCAPFILDIDLVTGWPLALMSTKAMSFLPPQLSVLFCRRSLF